VNQDKERLNRLKALRDELKSQEPEIVVAILDALGITIRCEPGRVESGITVRPVTRPQLIKKLGWSSALREFVFVAFRYRRGTPDDSEEEARWIAGLASGEDETVLELAERVGPMVRWFPTAKS
jgi:hypothetical protein